MVKTMEITTVIGCRVQCTFCPQTLLMNKYKESNNLDLISWGNPVVMSFDTFKECIDKIPTDIDIHFSGFAEPWLNPHCTEMLLYAHKKGHHIAVFSTLTDMTVEDVDLIKDVPFIRFHVHLADENKFAKIAVNSKYLEVLRKLISSKIRNLTYMAMGTLPKVIQDVIGLDFVPDTMIDRCGNCEFGESTPKKYGPLVCTKGHVDGINVLNENVLLPNGDVCLCCMDYGIENVLGNLLTSDYQSLFAGSKFKEILYKMHSENQEIICRGCPNAISYDAVARSKIIPQNYNPVVFQRLSELYKKILLRDIDLEGLNNYHHLINNKILTFDDVEKQIRESYEYKKYIHVPRQR